MKFIEWLDWEGSFSKVPSIVIFAMKGLCSIPHMNQNAQWPKYMQAEKVSQEMQGKKVETWRV